MSQFSILHFFIFLAVATVVLGGLHYWVYRSLRGILRGKGFSRSTRSALFQRSIAALFIIMDIPWAYFYMYRLAAPPLAPAIEWFIKYPFALWQGILFFWVIVLLTYSPVKFLVRSSAYLYRRLLPKQTSAPVPADLRRRNFIRAGALGVSMYAFGATAAGLIDRDDYIVDERRFSIPGLPASFKGFSIALISDIHSGIYMDKKSMENYAQLINGMRCDMIVLPGDFITSLDREIHPFADAFSELHAPSGVFGCTGNHEYFADADFVCKHSEQAGIRMLRNENLAIERNGEKIVLLGIDDLYVGNHEPERYVDTGKSEAIENMLRGVPAGAKKILLCHRPYPFEEFAQCGVDLMLSGHTHGGQIALANFGNWNVSFAALASRFIQGHYRSRANPASQLYVSRGVGTVGLPIRLNCPPEITKIVLT